jgi:hypothetical protein
MWQASQPLLLLLTNNIFPRSWLQHFQAGSSSSEEQKKGKKDSFNVTNERKV